MMNGEMARIFFKSGKQQMGLLLNDVDKPESFADGIRFVSNDKLPEWLESFSGEFVETLPVDTVDGIDVFMK
jgi:hypothetical protein